MNDATEQVSHQFTGSIAPENVGHGVTRMMQVGGDTLTIGLDMHAAGGTPVGRTVAWARAG